MGVQNGEDDNGIEIAPFEDWMTPQVVEMTARHYNRDVSDVGDFFQRFYNHPFQRSECLRIVALDGDQVCGFQSFFYWPYFCNGKPVRSFQSGQSLVHPEYRGRGVFAALLNHLWETDERPRIDFVMGFPVQMSFGSFMRNGWFNPLDLKWYVRIVRSNVAHRGHEDEPPELHFDSIAEHIEQDYPSVGFTLSKEPDFVDWRDASSQDPGERAYFHYYERGRIVRLDVKRQRRRRFYGVIIGDVTSSTPDGPFLRRAFRSFFRAVAEHGSLSYVSVAQNERSIDHRLPAAMWKLGFAPVLGKSIPFIVKPVDSRTELLDAHSWNLLRSDIDTW